MARRSPPTVSSSPEAAVWRYLQNSGTTNIAEVKLENFKLEGGGTITGIDKFWQQYNLAEAFDVQGEITINGGGSNVTFDTNTANFTCGADGGYEFVIHFDEGHMTVSVDAYSGAKNPVTTKTTTEVDTSISSTKYAEVTTTTAQTAITWDQAVIAKAGE